MANTSSDTPETNENLSAPNWSDAEYRKLCKQIKAFQTKKTGGKRKPKPMLRGIGEVVSQQRLLKIAKTQSDWESLRNGEPFALDTEATLVFIKTGRERAMCFNTMTSVPVASALVHRVYL